MPMYSSVYKTTPDKAIDKFFKHRPNLEKEWRDLFEQMLATGVDYYSDQLEGKLLFSSLWTFKARLEYNNDETYISLRLR